MMRIEKTDWSVLVIGHWNQAILTPSGIAKRLFGLPAQTPVQIEVPMDGLAPYRVKHEDITVAAEPNRLSIFAATADFATLAKAMNMGVKAIKELPETPLSAAGYNIQFRITDPEDNLIRILSIPLDTRISDASFQIKARAMTTSLEYGIGVINLIISEEKDKYISLDLNFHVDSNNATDLTEWLGMPVEDIEKAVDNIMVNILDLKQWNPKI